MTEKVRAAQRVGLKVIACVGELLSEREAGETISVVSRQMQAFAGEKKTEQTICSHFSQPDRCLIRWNQQLGNCCDCL